MPYMWIGHDPASIKARPKRWHYLLGVHNVPEVQRYD